MFKSRLWVALPAALVPAALALTLAGPLRAGDQARAAVEPRVTITRTATIPGGAFIPTNDDLGFQIDGNQVVVVGPSTHGWLIAPLFFEAQEITVRKMVLFAYDNGPGAICVALRRTTPADGGDETMGEICSTGAVTGVRSFTLPGTSIDPKRILGGHGAYFELYLPGTYTGGYAFYALRITYQYDV